MTRFLLPFVLLLSACATGDDSGDLDRNTAVCTNGAADFDDINDAPIVAWQEDAAGQGRGPLTWIWYDSSLTVSCDSGAGLVRIRR